MGDIYLSGYKAAAASVSFTGTQTLTSLADGEYTNLSDEIDNSSNLYAFADLELVLASAAFTGTDSVVEIYLVPSVDGTNYPTWTGNVTTDEQENYMFFVGSMITTGTTAAQRMTLRDVALPNGKYKWGVRNNSGVAFSASTNTLSWRPHQIQAA
jgi:hypothetical protein